MWERKFKMKICLLGDGGVGKTSLVRRFVFNEFDDRYLYTLGTNVSKKDVRIGGDGDGELLASLLIWDIMGQKTFMPLLSESYFDGADGAVAVCDITRRATLEGLREWIASLSGVAAGVPLVLLANKADLKDAQELSEEDIGPLAEEFDAKYYMTSAKTGRNVEEAFREIAIRVLDRAKLDYVASTKPAALGNPAR
jgi:small GTP-binding protein